MVSLLIGVVVGAVVVVLVPTAFVFVKKQLSSVKKDVPVANTVISAVENAANTVSKL